MVPGIYTFLIYFIWKNYFVFGVLVVIGSIAVLAVQVVVIGVLAVQVVVVNSNTTDAIAGTTYHGTTP